jgi:hypothetical protein
MKTWKLNFTNSGSAKKELSDYAVVSGGYDRIYYNYFMQFKPLTISDNYSELSTSNRKTKLSSAGIIIRLQALIATFKKNYSIN